MSCGDESKPRSLEKGIWNQKDIQDGPEPNQLQRQNLIEKRTGGEGRCRYSEEFEGSVKRKRAR
jgi:hypothetical protein